MDSRRMVVLLLAVFVVLFSIILWLFLSQDRYEREADELRGQGQYQQAIDKLQRAYGRTTLSGKDRILYKLGETYHLLSDDPRANDLLYQVMRDFPESQWSSKAEQLIQQIFKGIDGPIPMPTGSTPLAQSRSAAHLRLQRLLAEVTKNRSGVPGRLKDAYEEYKTAFTSYQTMLATEYRKASALEAGRRAAKAAAAGEAPSAEEQEPDAEVP